MNKKSNSIVKFSVSVLLAMLLLGIAAGTASAENASATIRAYGDDDIGPGTTWGLTNPVQGSLAPNIYQYAEDAFNPTVIKKDSITFNPAIILWDGQLYPMSANSQNIDVKKFARIWYEPNHTYNGWLNNPTYHPTIELETTYLLIDSKHKLPTAGSAGATTFAFPIAEKAGQIGLGSFDGDGDGLPDLVDLNYVSGAGTAGTIQIQKRFILDMNEQVQFLDHKLRFVGVYTDPQNSNIKYAKVEITYAGNLVDDTARVYDLTPRQTFFDRHNRPNYRHPDATWYAQFVAFNAQGQAQIIVGKEISAGDTFYVNSVRYDVPAVYVPAEGYFKYITLRSPLPKGTDVPLEASVVTSQWITEIPPNTPIPINPPFNQENGYKMIDDTNVVLWKPTAHISEWPTGPFPEGERYLTQQNPSSAWISYFGAAKILVKDTEGNDQWIAYEVNGRILDATKFVFTYRSEDFEKRYSTDLLQVLNETINEQRQIIQDWTKYIIQTRPDQYTEFILPPRPDVVVPGDSKSGVPASRVDLDDAYKGDYLVTTSFYAPDSTTTSLIDPFTGKPRAAFSYDPENGLDIYVNKLTDPVVRIYGEDDVGVSGITNNVNPGSVDIYANYKDPFNPAVIRKDSITFNKAIIEWDGQLYPMSADSKNIDVKKYLRTWYEPNHTYNGKLNNPTYHPTIELENTYLLIDSKHKLPTTGSAGTTTFAFPIAEKAGQIGIGSFDGNGDGVPDLVDLALVSGSGTQGTIRVQKDFNIGVGEQVQFLDHKLKFLGIYEDPNNNTVHYAKVQIVYAGNLADDTLVTVDLGKQANNPQAITFFDRHNIPYNDVSHTDRTWYAKLEYYSADLTKAQIIVGKEISAGDTFYVNSVRNDVRAVYVPIEGKFKYITISTPLPKCGDTPLEASTVTSQWITEIPPNTEIPINPPFNGVYSMVDDINVILWKPTAHTSEWPTGPFPEGERYLTVQNPSSAWRSYFGAVKVDTDGDGIWIAYDVNERILKNEPKLNFSYVDERFERRYSTDLLEILNETTPETWKKYDIRTLPDQYTEFKLPKRSDLVPPVRPDVENWGDYLVTLSWVAPNSIGTEHNLLHPYDDGYLGLPRVAFVYDADDSTGLYVNELTEIPPSPPNQAPVATFTVNTPVQALVNVVADPTGTYDPNGDAITLTWNWGDGTTPVTIPSVTAVTHQYTRANTYTITLSVSDGTTTATFTRTVQVTNDGIVISFKPGWNQVSIPISTATPLGVLFAGVPGYTQTWTWNGATQSYVSVGGSAPVVGKGYFVFASAPYDLTIRGTGVSKTAADIQGSLVAGWNMVGPGIDTISFPSWDWNYNYNPATNSYAATNTMAPGKGYWKFKN